jgi:uncharacterized membrane protein YsdA (DUF1294 family)/cold shock CspA family protein
MRYQGRITTWNDDKGFGFITPNGGGERVFVHISAFSNRQRRPDGNEIVTYELKVDGRGRTQANTVAFVGERATPCRRTSRSNIPPLFAFCFLLFVAAAAFSGRLPVAVLVLYLVASVVAFLAYAFDKSAALRDQWRTQESTLHLFALLGGWPGALAAQRLLRHKSAKASFQAAFWVTVGLNCGTLGWLLSPSGAQTLHSLLGAV